MFDENEEILCVKVESLIYFRDLSYAVNTKVSCWNFLFPIPSQSLATVSIVYLAC